MVCFYHFILHTDTNGQLFEEETMIKQIGYFGINGVYVFFVISGFVIPLALAKNNFQLRQTPRFLLKRIIRIEIPYLASILLILFVSFLYALKNDTAFIFNIKQFILHLCYLIPFTQEEWYNVIYWTLAIEFQFYILIAILFPLFNHSNKKIQIIALLLFGLGNLISVENRLIFHYTLLFLPGILLYLIKTNKISINFGFSAILCCLVGTAYCHSLIIACFCLLTVLAIHFLEINTKWSNRLGEISYSLYLTHGVIGGNLLYLIGKHITSFNGRLLVLIPTLILSFLFAWLFWKLIENPSKRKSSALK
jgi:peptidoglycan/LPS O-acetylase OafA/YrhL